jgi:hypothetical protein
MRHVTLHGVLAVAIACAVGTTAHATPFQPATVPDQVQAVGHVDVDALRNTQLFAAIGGEAHLEGKFDEATPELRQAIHGAVRASRGISFWKDGEHGALYLETRDGQAVAQLVAKLSPKPAAAVDGVATFSIEKHGKVHFGAVVGDTLVLSDASDSLARSIRVLAGHAASLAGSNKLPLASRQGVFMFVTLGEDMLGSIQKSAHSKMLQLGLKSAVVDVTEVAGVLTASAHAEMSSADALQKAKRMLDGLQSMASMSDSPLHEMIEGATVTTNGLGLDVVAKMPVADAAKALHPTK